MTSTPPPELLKNATLPMSPSKELPPEKANKEEKNPAQKLVWEDQTEEMLAAWGDEAACYKWMHDQAFRKYDSINFGVSVPIFIFSTISGTVSVAMPSLVPAEYVDIAQKIVGGVNIVVGILNAFQSNEKWAQKSESHKQASAGWGKLERNIRIELKIPRQKRKDADFFHKICRNEYDRLLEQSPIITEDIIERFKGAFRKNDNLVKPDICDNLRHTEVTKPLEEPEEELPEEIKVEVPSAPHEEVLKEIREILAESRIVPVGIRDTDISFHHVHQPRTARKTEYGFVGIPPTTKQEIPIELAPRKSFLGTPPPIIKTESTVSLPSVKELAKKFQTRGSVINEMLTSRTQAILSDMKEQKVLTPSLKPTPTNGVTIEVVLPETTSTPSEIKTPRQHIQPIPPLDLAAITQDEKTPKVEFHFDEE